MTSFQALGTERIAPSDSKEPMSIGIREWSVKGVAEKDHDFRDARQSSGSDRRLY